jgi:NAD(P)H-flavin reductase
VILKLSLPIHNTLKIKPGQFVNLTQQDLTRSYSIANNPQKDKFIELHIQKVQNGEMSNWLYDNSDIGDSLKIKGPFGTCVYLESHLNNALVLIGTGTGLAPLIGIIKQALANNHQGNITLFHGSRHINGLYLHQDLKNLASEHDNFIYYPCLSGESEDREALQDENITQGRVNKIAMSTLTQFNSAKFYLCGHPDMVKNMKKMLYLSGADLNNINADPFEYTDYNQQAG